MVPELEPFISEDYKSVFDFHYTVYFALGVLLDPPNFLYFLSLDLEIQDFSAHGADKHPIAVGFRGIDIPISRRAFSGVGGCIFLIVAFYLVVVFEKQKKRLLCV